MNKQCLEKTIIRTNDQNRYLYCFVYLFLKISLRNNFSFISHPEKKVRYPFQSNMLQPSLTTKCSNSGNNWSFYLQEEFFLKCIESILRIAAPFQQLCMFKRNIKLKHCWLVSTVLVVVITNRPPNFTFQFTHENQISNQYFYGFSLCSNGNISRIFLFHLLLI